MQQESFVEKIWLIAIDKLAIGILIAIAGFVLSRVLERFKSQEALTNEVIKNRVSKLSETWSTVYVWENSVLKSLTVLIESQLVRVNNPENYQDYIDFKSKPLEEETQRLGAAVQESMNMNRFWLGEELYQHIREYHDDIIATYEMVLQEDSDILEKAIRKIENSKQDVFAYMEKQYHIKRKFKMLRLRRPHV